MSERRLVVLSVSTEPDAGSANFANTAEHFGYEYHLLCRGDQFRGWAWRTARYIDAIVTLQQRDDDVFVMCDSSDLFIARPPSALFQAFDAGGHDVVIGAEPACCNGRYQSLSEKHIAVNGTKRSIPDSRYRFPNGGFVIGKAGPLLRLLRANQNEPDDQGGYLQKILDGYGTFFVLDVAQSMAGNIPNMHGDYWVAGDDRSIAELDRWVIAHGAVKHAATGNEPSFLHFPGRHWTAYNAAARHLFPRHYTETPQSSRNEGPVTLALPMARRPTIEAARTRNARALTARAQEIKTLSTKEVLGVVACTAIGMSVVLGLLAVHCRSRRSSVKPIIA